ncbi:glycosyltransferase family 9 protein [Nocardia sp. NPDC051787]|uniref:glycosyltransferase family 9 protein n=1 Tax=Nocardia sp. NPDC051787 TaxID=3155415 RepID=UPI0034218D27
MGYPGANSVGVLPESDAHAPDNGVEDTSAGDFETRFPGVGAGFPASASKLWHTRPGFANDVVPAAGPPFAITVEAYMAVTLALCAHGLRELLTAVPALRALHDALPRQRLVLAAPGWLRPVVELADCVDELHATPLPAALRWNAPPPTFAVDLHGADAGSIGALLATGPAHMIAHRHKDFSQIPGPAWQLDLPETVRWCRLLEYAGIPADPARLDIAPPPESIGEPEFIVVHAGGAPARRWPAERFAAVAADAALVVSGDTGVGHLATAFGTPSVLIFGPESPATWGPPPEREAHMVLWAGRVDDPLADAPAPGLDLISVAEVVAAADRQLTSRALV